MNKIYPFQPMQCVRNNKYYLHLWIHLRQIISTESRNPRLVKRNPSLVLEVTKSKISIRRLIK